MSRFAEGSYEPAQNILHLWYARPVRLDDAHIVAQFFADARDHWIRACTTPPYLLVNYAKVTLRANMVEAYSRQIATFQELVLGTFRYGIEDGALGHFTAVAVHLGTAKLSKPPNVFASEAEAREAIGHARMRARSARA